MQTQDREIATGGKKRGREGQKGKGSPQLLELGDLLVINGAVFITCRLAGRALLFWELHQGDGTFILASGLGWLRSLSRHPLLK